MFFVEYKKKFPRTTTFLHLAIFGLKRKDYPANKVESGIYMRSNISLHIRVFSKNHHIHIYNKEKLARI